MVQHVNNYYMQNGSGIYCTLLDASKAFDRVQYCKLFNLLIQRGICPVVIRLLLRKYTSYILEIIITNVHFSYVICWNGSHSQLFNVSNGVKQGKLLLPI